MGSLLLPVTCLSSDTAALVLLTVLVVRGGKEKAAGHARARLLMKAPVCKYRCSVERTMAEMQLVLQRAIYSTLRKKRA